MRLGKILLFVWLFALAQGAQAVAAPRENALRYDEVVSGSLQEYWDQDAQLLYLRARWYDPKIGRFISGDPFEGTQQEPRSLNRDAYVANNPIHNVDPTGLMTLTEFGQALATGMRQSLSSVGNFRVVVEKTGCLLIEAIVEETIMHGVYVFFDEMHDPRKPYVGKTKNDLQDRIRDHARTGTRRVPTSGAFAKIKVEGDAGLLQVIEQLLFDMLSQGDPDSLSNKIRPLRNI